MASLVAQMVKASAYNVVQSLGGEDPRRRQWQPTLVFLPGEFHGQRSPVGYSLWGRKELYAAEQLTHTKFSLAGSLEVFFFFFFFCFVLFLRYLGFQNV